MDETFVVQAGSMAIAEQTAKVVQIERLEYGKLCQTPNGPIVKGLEHGQLGASPNFPKQLYKYCVPDPTLFGISASHHEHTAKGFSHGTVLRPLSHEGRLWPTMCRVIELPEGGPGTTGRNYHAARYVTATSEFVAPSVLLRALESTPLVGLTKEEANSLSDFELTAPAYPPTIEDFRLGDKATHFLDGFFRHLFSGISVCLEGQIEETEFFAWVSLVWWALPQKIRPLLSAGWGVGPSLATSLMLSSTTYAGEAVAVFSLQTEEWRTPTQKVNGDRPISNGELVPGQLYCHQVYKDASLPTWPFERQNVRADEIVSPFSLSLWDGLAPFDHPNVRKSFRAVGLTILDRNRIEQLQSHLELGVYADARFALSSLYHLTYEESRVEAAKILVSFGVEETEAGVHLLADEAEGRKRADRFLWNDIGSKMRGEYRKWLPLFPPLSRRRIRLFLALAEKDKNKIYESLFDASSVGLDSQLPEEAAKQIQSVLGMSLEDGRQGLAIHKEFLRKNIKAYRTWLEREHLNLGFSALEYDPVQAPEFLALLVNKSKNFSHGNVLQALERWSALKEPLQGDIPLLVAGLPEECRRRFRVAFLRAWQQGELSGGLEQRRVRLLLWLDCVGDKTAKRSASLLLAKGVEHFSTPQLNELAMELEKGLIPSALDSRLATLVRRSPLPFLYVNEAWLHSVSRRFWDITALERFNALRIENDLPPLFQAQERKERGRSTLRFWLVILGLTIGLSLWFHLGR